jgi:hypothetical protein
MKLNKFDEGKTAYDHSRQIQERILERAPENLERRLELAVSKRSLGEAFLKISERDGDYKLLERARDLCAQCNQIYIDVALLTQHSSESRARLEAILILEAVLIFSGPTFVGALALQETRQCISKVFPCLCLVVKLGANVPLTRSLFGDGIPRSLLLRVSLTKSTSARLRF